MNNIWKYNNGKLKKEHVAKFPELTEYKTDNEYLAALLMYNESDKLLPEADATALKGYEEGQKLIEGKDFKIMSKICGVTCHPGDENCNNYCNKHPNKKNMTMPDNPNLFAVEIPTQPIENKGKCYCGVPISQHGTCCGWESANIIFYPWESTVPSKISNEEKEMRWLLSTYEDGLRIAAAFFPKPLYTTETHSNSGKGKILYRLSLNLPDTSVKEFADELIEQLSDLRDNFDTHAMTDHTNFLQGQKKMLTDIIDYLIKAKP